MSANIYSNLPDDGFEPEEINLYNLVNNYRAQNGLPAIAASKALSTVANRHVHDLAENIGSLTHSWSDAPYDPNNPSTYTAMWEAPKRLNTGYAGSGYENAFWTSAGVISGAEALHGWKNSPSHNAVILNQGNWQNLQWNALGIGIYQGYAVLWFGHEGDPTGTPVFVSNTVNALSIKSLTSTEDKDTLTGTEGNDTILGAGGDDVIIGNAAEDALFGNQGNDTLFGNQGNDTLLGGKENDVLQGGKENDVLLGNLGSDSLYGNLGDDTLLGGKDDDILFGGKENDVLSGDLGNDILSGDLGFDTLTGSGGSDTFALQPDKGTDVITDFQDGVDLIGLGGGLTFANLSITQGSGDNAANTLIASNGQLLAVLTGIPAAAIADADFRSI